MKHVGRNTPHDSAVTHVSGASVFIDDIAPLAGELFAVVVPCPAARAKVVRVDLSAAMKVPGVVAAVTGDELGEHNAFGPVVHDERLFAAVGAESDYVGHPVAVIAAETREAAYAARAKAVVEVEKSAMGGPVLAIDQAIAAGSFLGGERKMARGDVEAALAASEQVAEGVLHIGGQEHFYLETQACVVVPGEQRTFTVKSSTQHPSEVQAMVAEVLGVPFANVACECLRMGGGFGGKETQAAQPAMLAALLADKTQRPVRMVLDRDDDMELTGKRHPFRAAYKVGFTKAGEITALDLALHSNGGCSTDLSFAVLERAMLHSDNAYFLPAVRITGRVCRTHLPSNTAFRGFGGPQGVAAIENIIERVAHETGLDPLEVRRRNLYREGKDTTHYGQVVRNNTLARCIDGAARAYAARRAEITKFNEASRTHVRGIAISPVKFGISFTRRTLNQANALVNVYLDGSVLVTTGATEMGQGVHTRIRQVVADEFALPLERVRVGLTSTEKNNNTSPTAASTGTDLNGAAAVEACRAIRARLAEVAASMLADPASGLAAERESVGFEAGELFDARRPDTRLSFKAVVGRAYELRVSLGERGFYTTPGVDFNRETGKGTPFLYYTNGAACTEVLLDRLTGELKVTRVDLVMDAGKMINPGIDRGQVIGGFVQGMGWCTMEELVYGPGGELRTHSPDTYKIPAVSDVPAEFDVAFLDNPDNDVSLHRSKSVGEPPLLLGLSAWLAVRDAVRHVRAGAAVDLALPATGERLLLAMEGVRP